MGCRHTCVRSMTGHSKPGSHSDFNTLPRWFSAGPHSLNLSQHSSVKIRRQLSELLLPPLFLEQHRILAAWNDNENLSKTSHNLFTARHKWDHPLLLRNRRHCRTTANLPAMHSPQGRIQTLILDSYQTTQELIDIPSS